MGAYLLLSFVFYHNVTVASHLDSALGSCCTISFDLLSLGNPILYSCCYLMFVLLGNFAKLLNPPHANAFETTSL